MQPLKSRTDPAPSRLAYRLQRLMLTPAFRLVLRVWPPFVLAFVLAAAWLGEGNRPQQIVLAMRELRQQIETRPEFMVNLLRIEGASPGLEAEIRESFPYELPASSFSIDLEHVRAVLRDMPAVADAELGFRRGGVLTLRVRERVPVLVWRHRAGLSLIDGEGVEVARLADPAARPALPMVAGEGADADVAGALAILAAAAPLEERVAGLVRVGQRRWDLVLVDGRRILLPAEGAVRALERVIVLDEVQELLARDVGVIDMRLPDRPTVRMNAHALEEWWRVMQRTAGVNRG
ncbi:MAG: cell division protein FtsQ/DivIB [Roseovarius sp.]